MERGGKYRKSFQERIHEIQAPKERKSRHNGPMMEG
jgi:hypothetical protein